MKREYSTLGASASQRPVIVAVRQLSSAQAPESISGLTYAVHDEKFKRENRASWNKFDVIATAAILSIVAGVYLYFSFWLY